MMNALDDEGEMGGNYLLLTNEAGEKQAPEWIEVPFGYHDHAAGMQVFDAAAGEAMRANFMNTKAKRGRTFKGIPVYLGHPDDPKLSGTGGDKRARGWIRQMEVSGKGLRLKMDWTRTGRREVEEEEVAYFSPRWAVQKMGQGSRNYQPVRLISVGLVNDPNIEGILPLTNESGAKVEEEKEREKTMTNGGALPPWVHELAGTNAERAGEEEARQALEGKVNAAGQVEAVRKAREALAAATAKHQAAMDELQKTLANERAAAEDAEALANAAQAAAAAERKGRAELLVEKLVTSGRITLAAKAETLEELCNSGGEFNQLAARLCEQAPILPMGPAATANLGRRRGEADAAQTGESARQGRVIALVNERMARTGEAYQQAWTAVRREHPTLFEEMRRPVSSR